MLKLHSAPRTRRIRIAWLLEKLGKAYELSTGEFSQTTPTGKCPTIDDDGFITFESDAIVEYLLKKYIDSTFSPERGDPERGEFLQWMYFADATAFSPSRNRNLASCLSGRCRRS